MKSSNEKTKIIKKCAVDRFSKLNKNKNVMTMSNL